MNRRRMMMLQQSKGFELVYDAAIGTIPPTTEWKTYHFSGGNAVYYSEGGCLSLDTGYAGANVGLMPTERVIGQADNISISTVARFARNWWPSITLSATNGNKGAIVKISISGTATTTTNWGINAWVGASQVIVATHSFDFIDNYAKIELVLTGDIYTLYINGEEIYVGQAANYIDMPVNYQRNMIANTYNAIGWLHITNMTYKEW